MRSKTLSVSNIAKIGVLTALAVVLMMFKVPLFFAPPFLKFDLAEVPSLLGSFAMGPVSGFIVVAIKVVLNLAVDGTTTAFVGEFSNLVVNGTFVVIAGWYYKRHRTFKGAIYAMILATLGMTLVATLSNYFVMFPLYARLYFPMEAIIDMGSKVNPLVNNYLTLMLFTIIPFNLLQGIITSLITTIIYPRVSSLLKSKD